MQVIDTNVVIRYLTGDHPDHSPRSIVYFDRLYTGEEQALMIEGVIVEIVQVLSSKKIHALPRSEIADGITRVEP